MTIQTTKIPRRQKCVDKDHPYIGGSVDIIDDGKNKTQEQINSETEERVTTLEESVGTGGSVDERIAEEGAKHYLKTETYNKTELNNLITTPEVNYVNVEATDQTTSISDVLPATGAADTTYRVGNWDGTQYNDSVFSEYAWNGSAYIKLSTKSQIGEVYDISANHADTKYADLAAALGTNGANIPQSLRKGGMSVKYVQSSDNKYVQYRLISNSFNTIPDNWVKVGYKVEFLQTDEVNAIPNSNPSKVVDIKAGNVVKCKLTGLPELSSSNNIEFGLNDANGVTIYNTYSVNAQSGWESEDITLSRDAVLAWAVFHGSDFDGRNVEWEVIYKKDSSDVILSNQNELLKRLRKSDVIQAIEKNNTTQVPSSNAVFEKLTYKKEEVITDTIPAIGGSNPTQTVDIKAGRRVKFVFEGLGELASTNYIQFGLNDVNGQTLYFANVRAEDGWKSDYITLQGDVTLVWLLFYGSDWTEENIEWKMFVEYDVYTNEAVKDVDLQKYQYTGNLQETGRGYGIDYDNGEVVESGYNTVVLGPIPINSRFRLVSIDNRISAAGSGFVFYSSSGQKIKPIGSQNYSDNTNIVLEIPTNAVSFKCSSVYNEYHRIYFYTSKYERNNYKLVELFGGKIGDNSSFGNAKIATDFCEGEGSPLSPYTSGDHTGGINTAIGENVERGGKIVIPVGEYTISSPIIIRKECINLEGEIWNYPAHPNGVYESNNGSKLKLASNTIPAISFSQTWNGWRIAQIGVAGLVSNGATKGLFDKNNPGKNCALLINHYTDQFEINRVSCEGLAAGIVGLDCAWDAGIISRVNADGCNIGIYLDAEISYYFKIKDCILSDCPAFGMYIHNNNGGTFGGVEICGNVMVRNAGGLTPQQITDFGGEEEIASCVIKGLSASTFHHNFIHNPGTWMNPTSGTPTPEYQERYGILFEALNSTFEGNSISGGKGNVIRGNCVNVISNVMPAKLILDGENHLITGNVVSEIVVNADGCTIMNNRCTSSKITINGDDNYIVCPQGYTVVDNGSGNSIVRL